LSFGRPFGIADMAGDTAALAPSNAKPTNTDVNFMALDSS
jgi:hypothetical protein